MQKEAQNNKTITPLSKFTPFKIALEKIHNISEPTYFVKNVTNEFITHYHAYPGAIFEVIPDCDLIASVTLFK
jgi:hypothetical protein